MNKSFLFFTITIIVACNNSEQREKKLAQRVVQHMAVDSAGWPASFGFGHDADTATIAKLDSDIRPDGKGLPHGEGNAVIGKSIYAAKCIACHGGPIVPAGVKFSAPPLISNPDSPKIKTIGNYWPYATTVFDYVRRAMPYNAPGSLSNDEVYSLTAYLLHANKLIDSTALLNAALLPKIIMPAQRKFVADDRKGGPEIK